MKTPPGLTRPVGTIWCVGRNYAEHARELGNAVPEAPLIFLKPASCLLFDRGVLALPADSKRVDHEVELVVAVGPVLSMAVGVDFTVRDIQQTAKAKGLPWTLAKARPGFAAVGNFTLFREGTPFSLSVNGALRQEGDPGLMIWSVRRLIDYLSRHFTVEEGDLLYTGTPPGVGYARTPPVFLKPGDVVEVEIERLGILRNPVAAAG